MSPTAQITKRVSESWGSTLKPLVDFNTIIGAAVTSWGSTLKPPGRLLDYHIPLQYRLGINSQTPW